MASTRRQLSLFLPEPARTRVDAARARLDPRQHAIIPAHATLCRDAEIEPWADCRASLAKLQSVDIRLAFGKPVRLEDGCIALPVIGSTESYDRVRRQILGPDCVAHHPHITLLHPRHAAGRNDDLESLSSLQFPAPMQFFEISVIELAGDDPWRVVERFPNCETIAIYETFIGAFREK